MADWPDTVAALVRTALREGEEAWIVGGAVRDELLGRPSNDVDLAVRGDVEYLATALADELEGGVFAVSERFSTFRVLVPGGGQIDLAPLRGATLAEDLAGRDFTVNALARGLGVNDVIDPHGGRADLEVRVLRPCAPDAFAADPVRVARLVRFTQEFGFTAARGAQGAARAAAAGLAGVSGERLEAELSSLLALPAAARAIRDLDALDGLAPILPELVGCKGVTQNLYHHLDVFEHTLEALEHLPAVVTQLGGAGSLTGPRELGLSADEPLVPLSYVALCHDLGKPAARAIDDDGRVMFWHHDRIGEDLAAGAARRLKTSRRFEDYLRLLVRTHLRLGFLAREAPLSQRALARFRRATEPYVFEAVAISLADRMATRGEKTSTKSVARHFRLARDVLEELPPPAPRLLSGEEVMELLGLRPGPEVGEALELLQDEADAGEVVTAEGAREFLVRAWAQRGRD